MARKKNAEADITVDAAENEVLTSSSEAESSNVVEAEVIKKEKAYSREKFLTNAKYGKYFDLLSVMLKCGRLYTEAEVEKIISLKK